jgi:hypothetical protein
MSTVTSLRKIFTEQGIKGASKWNREIFDSLINQAWDAANEEDANRKPIVETVKAGRCTECGRREDFRASGLCRPCREFGEWENTHADEGHQTGNQQITVSDCPVCHPELDPRTARKTGRSRVGMVIVAKGTEMHKSLIFKAAAEAVGWTVEIARETYELAADAEGEGTRFYATATKTTQLGADDSISLAWDGRAYDYDASSAVLAGKGRKVRNLKEALRLL